MKVLILCTGNSCRSQMAHGFLQSFDSRITVKSAGTQPAERVNQTAVKVMGEIGIDISKNIPTLVDEYINQEWDYVITVCDDANETCPVFIGKVKNRLHMGFVDPSHKTGSEEFVMSEFYRIRNLIKERFFAFYNSQIKSSL